MIQVLPTEEGVRLLPQIPPTAVGRSFKSYLQKKELACLPQIPPTAVGGSFKSCLQKKELACLPQIPPTPRGWYSKRSPDAFLCRLDLNDPPTPVGGI